MVWVQPDGPNTTVYPLACHNLDAIDGSLGGVTTRYCRTATGGWSSVARSQGSPGDVTGTIEAWLGKTQSWLQLIAERRCPFAVYIHHTDCERDDIFLNYDHGELLQDTIITSRSKGALVKTTAVGEEDSSPSTMSFDVNASHPINEYWPLVEFYRSIAEDEALRDIAFCNEPRCIGACGAAEEICTDGVIVADAATGLTAEIWFTVDGGATWTPSATDPFIADMDVNSVVCFQIGRGVMRTLVQRGTTSGANLTGQEPRLVRSGCTPAACSHSITGTSGAGTTRARSASRTTRVRRGRTRARRVRTTSITSISPIRATGSPWGTHRRRCTRTMAATTGRPRRRQRETSPRTC
jgi:hypothetical protein